MAKKSIKKNYIYNVCYQILLLIAPVLTVPHLSRTLGADGIGQVSYAESIVSYFVLFASMGITTYGQREISYVQDSREKRSYVFWNTKALSFCTAGTAILVYIFFALFQENSVMYFILALNIAAVWMDVTWFFQGMEEFGKIILRNALIKLANIIYIFLVIRTKDDILYYVFGMAFFTFLSNVLLWGYLPRYIDRVPLKKLRPFKDLKIVLSLFIPTIAIQVYTVLDRTMIGIITRNSFENGYYEQALKISKMLLSIVTALGTVMVPRIGYLFEKGSRNDIQKYMYRGYRFVWFLGIPMCFGMIMTAGNFVPWFFGDGYRKVISLLQILSLLILAIGINNVTGVQYLIPTKKQNVFTLTVVIGAITNFSFNMVLIFFFKSIGAAIASVMAESTIAIVQLIIVRKEIAPMQVVKEGIHYYIAGGIMIIFLVPITRILTPSVLHSIIIVLSGAAVYYLVLLAEKDEFLISNIRTVTRKLIKR